MKLTYIRNDREREPVQETCSRSGQSTQSTRLEIIHTHIQIITHTRLT